MKTKLNVQYTEMVTPPRCRKARPQEGEAEITINIRETTEDRAPVAFIVTEYDREPEIVRLYNGKLYKQVQDRQKQYYDTNERDESCHFWLNQTAEQANWKWLLERYGRYKTLAENTKSIKERADKFIIVDGMVYQRTGEPYYYGITFGLGMNHGGTGFCIGWADYRDRKAVWGMSAADKQAAINEVVQIALDRGDTNYVNHIKNPLEHIEVLMPSAIKRRYTNQHYK